MPPKIVAAKGTKHLESAKFFPVGSIGGANPSGLSKEKLFEKWFEFFVEYVKPSKDEPVLLLLENDESHVTIAVIEKARSF